MSEKYICTAEEPWTPEKSTPAEHPDAEFVRTHDYGDYEMDGYKCPHCGLYFKVEIAR